VPEPLDRDAWLARVAASLDLPEPMAADIVEELAGHIDDAAAGYRETGYAPEDAERRAVRDLGDPRDLGGSLGRARRRGRFVLAAVGGGVRSVLLDGLRVWIVLWLVAVLFAMIALAIASTVLHLLGTSSSSYFGGPLGSAATLVVTWAWFAWVGWIVPVRVAAQARRSVRGVRRAVAVVGLVAGWWVTCGLLSLSLDPVLAVGLPVGPVVFAIAALRSGDRATSKLDPPASLRAVVAGTIVIVIGTTALAFATMTPSDSQGWEADLSALGASSDGYPALAATSPSISWGPAFGTGTSDGVDVQFADDAQAATFAAQLPVLRAELWPATVVDGRVRFGSAPVVASEAPVAADTVLGWTMPTPHDRISVAPVLVAIARDGTRVVVALGDVSLTPTWKGTVVDWWLGG
jgi:hypothetical protein